MIVSIPWILSYCPLPAHTGIWRSQALLLLDRAMWLVLANRLEIKLRWFLLLGQWGKSASMSRLHSLFLYFRDRWDHLLRWQSDKMVPVWLSESTAWEQLLVEEFPDFTGLHCTVTEILGPSVTIATPTLSLTQMSIYLPPQSIAAFIYFAFFFIFSQTIF